MREGIGQEKKKKFSIILGSLVLLVAVVVILFLEFMLESRKPLEIPFYNVIYPHVEFRPPSNIVWTSPDPSPSSRSGEYAKSFTNHDSFRIASSDYRLLPKKPVGQVRIAVVGGSTVHGGTTYEVTLPGALKQVLRTMHPSVDIEVINAGITSAISRQELVHLLTTVVDYNLDILVVYDGINDSGQMLYYEERPNFPYNYRVKELAWNHYVGGQREHLWLTLLRRSAIANQLWPEMLGERAILKTVQAQSLIKYPGVRQPYADAHVNNWEKIRRVCLAYHITPLFVLQPTSLYATFSGELSPQEMANSPRAASYANFLVYEDMRKKTKAFSVSHPEVRVLDLSSLLPLEAFYDGAHVYDDINSVIAKELAKSLQDQVVQIIERQPKL